MNVASLNIEELHNRFMLEQCPYWDLFNARGKDRLGKFRDDDDSIVSDQERVLYAWLQLEELLNTIPYGRAKITLRKSSSANAAAAITLYVQWGIAPTARSRAAGLGSSTSLGPAYAPQGVDSNPLMLIIKMQEETSRREAQAREAAHAREMDNMRLLLETKFEAQNLQSQIEGMQEGDGGGNMELVKDIVGMVRPFLMPAVRGAQPAMAPAQLGTAHGTGEVIADPLPPRPAVDAEGNRPAERRFCVTTALDHISVIRKNLPEYHVNDIIHALAIFTQNDPVEANMMVGMLMQKVAP